MRKKTSKKLYGCVSAITACFLLTGSMAQAQTLNSEVGSLLTVSTGDSVLEIQDEKVLSEESITKEEKAASEELLAVSEKDYILGREMTEEEIQQQLELHDFYTGLGSYIEMEGVSGDIQLHGGTSSLIQSAEIPSSYDSRDVNGACYISPVRNQNPYGTCWAFSAIACIEANLIKNGYADESIDLSERHLVYFSNHSVADELGNSGNDESYYNGSTSLYQIGGNTILAYRALAAWRGAVTEEFLPYEGIPEVPDTSAATVYDNDYVHLTGYYRISSDDTSAVKSAIMEYGAVSTSYYSDSSYLNAETAAYYCNAANDINHGIAIVGWDDNYSKTNFNTEPAADGAWLVKNSWGTSYGDGGYFWLSYEDMSLYGEMCAYEAELADNYDNNYQYDTVTGGLSMSGMPGKSFASVFTTKANAGKQEKLSAVSIELYSPAEVEYSLQIYKNLTDAANPTSGEAMLTTPQTGVMKLAGYYTIPLTEEILLNQGETFSVVFTLSKEGSDYVNVATETDCGSNGFYSNATAGSGQSFISYNGSSWTDYGEANDRNFRMKAFTDNMDTASGIACTGVKLNQTTADLLVGDSLQLTATVLPENATHQSCQWKSGNTGVVTVSNTGLVQAVGEGTAVVTVTTADGGFTATCTITVEKLVVAESVTISKSSAELLVGGTLQLSATVKPTDAVDKSCKWTSSNSGVVTVSSTGLVRAVGKGTAVVTVTTVSGGYKATCTITVKEQVVAQEIVLSKNSAELWVGDSLQLSATVKPTDAVNKSCKWTSSNTGVVTVSSSGLVQAVGKGTAVVTVATTDGSVTASCQITVKKLVLTQQIVLNKQTVTLTPGQTTQLTATVNPSDVTNGSLSWSSSDAGVVSVQADGTIKALSEGSAQIVARAKDGSGIQASCQVTVRIIRPASFTVKGVIGGRKVTFQSATEDAVIYYSTTSSTLTTSDRCVRNGETVLFEDFYGTVYARAYCDGVWSNVARLILKIPVVKTPTITQSGNAVTIKTATPRCAIYYTTDGSVPTVENGIKVNSSQATIQVQQGTTVKAIAVRSCFTNSGVAEKRAAYPVDASIDVPSFQVVGVIGGRKVTFSSDTQGCEIYYSPNSSHITTANEKVGNGGSVIFSNYYGTMYARAYKDGKWSNVARLILKIPNIRTPEIAAADNGYVTIRTATPRCTIYYTTDGSTPSPTNGRRINSSSTRVYVGEGRTVKAIAVRSCFTNSEVASFTR